MDDTYLSIPTITTHTETDDNQDSEKDNEEYFGKVFLSLDYIEANLLKTPL